MPLWPGQTVRSRAGAAGKASGSGNGPVGDDEELLSGPNEAEFAPGQFFDGRGVVTQAFSLEREVAVLPLELCNRLG